MRRSRWSSTSTSSASGTCVLRPSCAAVYRELTYPRPQVHAIIKGRAFVKKSGQADYFRIPLQRLREHVVSTRNSCAPCPRCLSPSRSPR